MSASSIDTSLASNLPVNAATAPATDSGTSLFGEIWDTINPLQHIPVISSLYRAASDTSISSFANIAGSTIYGGPIGGAVAAVEEGVSKIGHAILGDSKTATATAAPTAPVQATNIEPAAGTTPAHAYHHHKMHATTKDWLYQNLSNDNDSKDVADNSSTPATNANASAAYKKIQALTIDWLKPASQQLQKV